MGNEKSELEKLIEQAREMVGPQGSASVGFGDDGKWMASLRTPHASMSTWSTDAKDTAEEALRFAMRTFIDQVRAQADDARRVVAVAQRLGL